MVILDSTGHLVMKESGERSRSIDTTKHSRFKEMVVKTAETFANLLRAAFLPASVEGLPNADREALGRYGTGLVRKL